MASLLLAPLLAVGATLLQATAALAGDDSGGHPVLEMDFFRAMDPEGVNNWSLQNVDLASVEGMTKYVHTEVIAEHVIGDVERKYRKYSCDSFTKTRFKVKNPGSVVASSSKIVTQVDFGPFVTFDSGVATNPVTQTMIEAYGGFVGAQTQKDPRWPHSTPYYWFSVTGWCPNVLYSEVPMTREEAEQAILKRTSLCSKLQGRTTCEQSSDDCVYEDGACVARDPAPECLNYTSAAGQTGHVLGGLCPGGEWNLVQPTGTLGCTYSHAKSDMVSIDKVAGILDEDCGGRKCKSWIDFREHCTSPEYKQRFNPNTKKLEPFKYCVEYDISPLCESDCAEPACQALPESEREVGLPFWQGRCSEQANRARAQQVAAAFGAAQQPESDGDLATTRSSDQSSNGTATCIYAAPGQCAPSSGHGGNYCSREWSGVCTNCFVPGTAEAWPATQMPYCPYDILSIPDYKDAFDPPTCASSHPRDLCCLYSGGCSFSAADPLQAPLDEDGFALVASWGNSSLMATFLARVAEARYLSIDEVRLASFAGVQCGRSPLKGATLAKTVEKMIEEHVAVDERTSTLTGTATTSTATATTSTATGADAASFARQEEDSFPFLALVAALTLGAALCVAAAAVAGLLLLRRRRLDGRPSEPSARAGARKRPAAAAHVLGATASAAAEPDLEAAGPAAALPAGAGEVGVVPAAAADLPRLGLSGRSIAAPHQGQELEGCLEKASHIEALRARGPAPEQEPQKPSSPAALREAPSPAAEHSSEGHGGNSSRSFTELGTQELGEGATLDTASSAGHDSASSASGAGHDSASSSSASSAGHSSASSSSSGGADSEARSENSSNEQIVFAAVSELSKRSGFGDMQTI